MTFTKTPYGPVAKTTVRDAQQPNSPAQQAVKARFALVAASWNALSVEQRLMWGTASQGVRKVEPDTKKQYRSSGYAYYSSLSNVWYAAQGNDATPPAEPPAEAYAGSTVTISASASANSIEFSASALPEDGTLVELWIQPLRSASRKPAKDGYRVAAYATFVHHPAGSVTFTVAVPPGAYAAAYAFVDAATGQRTGRVAIPVAGVALAVEKGGAAERSAAVPKRKAA